MNNSLYKMESNEIAPTLSKPKITLCILTRDAIKAYTVLCLRQVSVDEEVRQKYIIEEQWAIGQSDLPKVRSDQLTRWYINPETTPQDMFMFIDADQTFLPKDLLRAVHLLKDADVVCGGYARNNLTPTVESENMGSLYKTGLEKIHYGSTGFMMISYPIVDKIAKDLKLVKISNTSECYPFFFERIVNESHTDGDLWLGEDYSFCWLARQHGGTILGFLSKSLGHLLTKNCHVEVPPFQKWKEKSIAIMTSKTPEKWSAKSLEKGIGGSELAVIELARLWVKNGYTVVVYCNCDNPSVQEGVIYQDYTKFQSFDEFDVLIVWRNTKLLNSLKFSARKLLFDMHDMGSVDNRVIPNVDKFCVKSRFHARACLSNVPEDKIAVIPNGGAEGIKETVEKDPFYLIYSSSYDRGLEHMLRWGWPKIKASVPQAYLNLYYGWDGFDAVLSMHTPEEQEIRREWKQQMLELMAQDGVKECGRIPRQELLKEKAKAVVHYYTGDFQEIDCISVRESASVGAIPVVSSYMEVFKEKEDYCILVDGDPKTQKMQEHAAELIIDLLKNKENTADIREQIKVPIDETWENVAKRWMELF